MNKKIVYGILLYTFVAILAFYSYQYLASGKYGVWMLIGVLIILGLGKKYISTIDQKFPKEYAEANRIAFTPKTSYGVYALIFAVVFFAACYVYIQMTRI